MANVNSITNNTSATSSLFANKNVLSGLASGMDTEAMIENSVSGYQTKISQLEQEQTKVQWTQDAMREIIDQSVALTTKYTSYSSSTNLMSTAFYTSASSTVADGTYASAVSASGSSSNNVEISQIQQLATSAYYTFSPAGNWGSASNNTTEAINLNSLVQINKNAGIVTLNYNSGGESKSVQFEIGDMEKSDSSDATLRLIQSKLSSITVTNAKGEVVKGSDYFRLSVENGKVKITGRDYEENGDKWREKPESVSVSLKPSEAASSSSTRSYLDATGGTTASGQTLAHYLSGKSITVTYNGLDKKITFPMKEPQPPFDTLKQMGDYIEQQINEAFTGDSEDKIITVSTSGSANTTNGTLTFNFTNTSGSNSLQISSDFSQLLGMGDKGLNTQVDSSKTTLGSVLGSNWNQPLKINGVTIATNFTRDSTIQDVMTAINNNSGRTGVSVSYSSVNSQFVFATTGTGSVQEIKLDGLARSLFGAGKGEDGYQEGKDAVMTVKINGNTQTIARSSNTVDLDGLRVTLKSTTPENAGITFNSTANSDKIVNAVKSFVEDFNKLVTSLRSACTTQPIKKSDGSTYEPLTEKDKSSMSESAIKNYEETAKQGLLFGDSDLNSMYSKLIRQIAPTSKEREALAAIGISTSYKDGLTTLTLDESKLRSSLDGGTEAVKKAFADSSYGLNDGIAGRMKKTLDAYTSTSMVSPGILVRKAGTRLSSLSLMNNSMQKKSDRIQTEIERWQTKMASKVDYYTRQFTKMEQLINTMNSQSSMITGMMGG